MKWYAILAFFISSCMIAATPEWSWLYQKKFSSKEIGQNRTKKMLTFVKNKVSPFTQLIFSWNSFRPPIGSFEFYAQVRNAKTKKWSSWHKMIEWGAQVQRSFASKYDGISKYVYVRLETGEKNHADAFRIKVASKDNACLSLLRGFAINVADFPLFKSELRNNELFKLSSVCIDGVPTLSQFMQEHPRNDGLCSPTSCTILTSFFLRQQIDVLHFAEKAYDAGLDKYGSWPFNMACAFELCQGTVWFTTARMNSFSELHRHLQKGIPVIVSIRGPIEGGAKPYLHGHLLVVIGYDAQEQAVICHDPAFAQNHETKVSYPLKSFLTCWEKSKRLAYLAQPVRVF